MADIAFGSVERAINLALKIQKQVKTVRQNEEECQDIEQDVGILLGILSLLQQKPEVTRHPAINGALLGLERSLDRALNLVTDCQSKKLVRRFLWAGDLSKKLLKVHNDIKWKMDMGVFATNVLQLELTFTLTNTIHCHSAHPALTQPKDAGVPDIPYISHLTTDDARSGVNSEITMVETGSKVPYAPSSSRLTVFNSSESEATMHQFSEETISVAGGHSIVMKQMIVIKVSMRDVKSRSKAMALVAATDGVDSVAVAGDAKDQLVVVGGGVDCMKITSALRRKVGCAQLLQVGDAKKDEKKPDDDAVAAAVPE